MQDGNIRNPLGRIRIASPCTADWEKMKGDDRVRFCLQCDKHVYNLSAMSSREAEHLIRETEGKICARFYVRRDGTMLTDDCPLGLRIARASLRKVCAAVTALASIILAVIPVKADNQQKPGSMPKVKQQHEKTWFTNQAFTGKIIDDAGENLSKARMAVEKGNASASDFVTVAWADFKAGKFDDAIAKCTKALSLDSNSIAAYDTRGHAELELKQYQSAIADFSKAISLDETLASTYYCRAMAYRSLGKVDLARKDEVRAKELGYTPANKDAN